MLVDIDKESSFSGKAGFPRYLIIIIKIMVIIIINIIDYKENNKINYLLADPIDRSDFLEHREQLLKGL